MTKNRILAAAAAAALTLGIGAGVASAQSRDGDDSSPSRIPAACANGDMSRGDMDDMHAQMRIRMPDNMQARHSTMHSRGTGMAGSMMNGMLNR
jgi:hypothetical protein